MRRAEELTERFQGSLLGGPLTVVYDLPAATPTPAYTKRREKIGLGAEAARLFAEKPAAGDAKRSAKYSGSHTTTRASRQMATGSHSLTGDTPKHSEQSPGRRKLGCGGKRIMLVSGGCTPGTPGTPGSPSTPAFGNTPRGARYSSAIFGGSASRMTPHCGSDSDNSIITPAGMATASSQAEVTGFCPNAGADITDGGDIEATSNHARSNSDSPPSSRSLRPFASAQIDKLQPKLPGVSVSDAGRRRRNGRRVSALGRLVTQEASSEDSQPGRHRRSLKSEQGSTPHELSLTVYSLVRAFRAASLRRRDATDVWSSVHVLMREMEVPSELFDELIVVVIMDLEDYAFDEFTNSPFFEELWLLKLAQAHRIRIGSGGIVVSPSSAADGDSISKCNHRGHGFVSPSGTDLPEAGRSPADVCFGRDSDSKLGSDSSSGLVSPPTSHAVRLLISCELRHESFIWLGRIGRGGYGAVFAAAHAATGMVYAIKRMNKRVIKQRRAERLILEERAVLEHITSRFVTDLKFAFQTAEEVCLGLELVGGGDLDQLLAKRGRLSETAAKLIAVEMAAAIHDLHRRGIMHRDIKPANVLLTPDGHVKLADLGLACFVGNGTMARVMRKSAQAAAQAASTASANSEAASASPGSTDDSATAAGSSTSPVNSHGTASTSSGSMGSAHLGSGIAGGFSVIAMVKAAVGSTTKQADPDAKYVLHGPDGTRYEQLKHGFVRVNDAYNVRPYARGRAGTPGFWAPEMLLRDVYSGKPGKYDGTADWWSFGCMLYALVTGRSPFSIRHGDTNDDNFATLHAEPALGSALLSPDLAGLLSQLLDKDPATRLGRNGAAEVMKHPWFGDVVWQDVFNGRAHKHGWATTVRLGANTATGAAPHALSTGAAAATAGRVSPQRKGARLPPISTVDDVIKSSSSMTASGGVAGAGTTAITRLPVDEVIAGFRLRLRHDQHPKDAKRLQEASSVVLNEEDTKLYAGFRFEHDQLFMRDVAANFGLVSFRESVNMAKAVRDGVVVSEAADHAQGLEVLQHALLGKTDDDLERAPMVPSSLSYGSLLYALGEFHLAFSAEKAAQYTLGVAASRTTLGAAHELLSGFPTDAPPLVTFVAATGDDHHSARSRLPWMSRSWQREAELGLALTRLGSLTTCVFQGYHGAMAPKSEAPSLLSHSISASDGVRDILTAANECVECVEFLRKSCDSLGRMIDSHGQHSLSAQLHVLAQTYNDHRGCARDKRSGHKGAVRAAADAACSVM